MLCEVDIPKGYHLNMRKMRKSVDTHKKEPESLHTSILAQSGEREKTCPLIYEQEASNRAVQPTEFTLSVWSEKPRETLFESGFRLVMLQVTGRSKHKLSLEEFDGNPG